MRQKFFYFTAIAVCLALAVAPTMAAERLTGRADRTERGAERGVDNAGSDDGTGMRPPAIGTKMYLADSIQQGADDSNGRSISRQIVSDPALLLGRAQFLQEQGQTERAVSLMQRILQMDLESTPENDKILFAASRALAAQYEGTTHKQVHYLTLALQHAPAGEQAALEDQIFDLGGDVFDVTFNNGSSTTNKAQVRVNDCSTAEPAPIGAGFVTRSPGIDTPATHEWFVFDITDPLGGVVTVETRPNAASASDDTDITLYTGTCEALVQVGFDDDSGQGLASLLQTACLDPGTYYTEIGGWLDIVAPGSYDVSFEVGECPVDLPLDKYEPDNEPEDAASIGQPNSAPSGNAWGRVNRQTQSRTIALGGDRDDVKFQLTRNEFVRASTAVQHASFFNNFEQIDLLADGSTCLSNDNNTPCDTTMELTFNEKKEWGGLCFDDNGFQGAITCDCPSNDYLDFPGACYSDEEVLDLNARLCPRPDGTFNQYCPFVGPSSNPDVAGGGNACNAAATAGFGNCSNMQTNVSGDPFTCGPPDHDGVDIPCDLEPLATSTDKSATDLGSELALCLPQTSSGSVEAAVNGPWHLRITGFGLTQFEYEVRVTAESECENWEVEPNGSFLTANDLTLGETIHAWQAYSESQKNLGDELGPFGGEYDIFAFNPPSTGLMTLATDSFDGNQTDTYAALYIGPDPGGNFLFLGIADDDGGEGLLSLIQTPPLPPAPDLFGGAAPDAKYLLAVNSAFVQADYPYSVVSDFQGLAAPESEPNDIFVNGTPMLLQPGDTVKASIGNGDCADMFRVELAEDTFITAETRGFTDTVMQQVDCETGAELYGACSDDNGNGVNSKIEGCYQAGAHCFRVTGFNQFTFGEYDLTVNRTGGCVALDPMILEFDNGIGCDEDAAGTCRE